MGVCPGFSCPREGESGEAPPVAEEASRFRGSAPVCGREASGNRKGATVERAASGTAVPERRTSMVAVPVRGAGCIYCNSEQIQKRFGELPSP